MGGVQGCHSLAGSAKLRTASSVGKGLANRSIFSTFPDQVVALSRGQDPISRQGHPGALVPGRGSHLDWD